MTDAERLKENWDYGTIVLVLGNGTIVYPSQDEEGNGPGALFGVTKAGKCVTWRVNEESFGGIKVVSRGDPTRYT